LFAWWSLHSVLVAAARRIFDVDFSSPHFDRLKTWSFSSGGVQGRAGEVGGLGGIVMSGRGLLFRSKQVSWSFP